jgi:hypothetical protein
MILTSSSTNGEEEIDDEEDGITFAVGFDCDDSNDGDGCDGGFVVVTDLFDLFLLVSGLITLKFDDCNDGWASNWEHNIHIRNRLKLK